MALEEQSTRTRTSSRKQVEYDEGRLWFSRKGDLVTIGLTEQGREEIGEITSLSLPKEGDDFDKEDVLLDLEGSETTLAVWSPAAGFISEVNTVAIDDPSVVDEDPMGEGWLVRLEIQDETDLQEYEASLEDEES